MAEIMETKDKLKVFYSGVRQTFFAPRTGLRLALFCGPALTKEMNVWDMQIYHHNTDSVRDLASFVAIRCSKPGVMVDSDTSCVLLLSSLFRVMVLVAVTTVLHGPEADSLRTSSGLQPGDCRQLVYSMAYNFKITLWFCASRCGVPKRNTVAPLVWNV